MEEKICFTKRGMTFTDYSFVIFMAVSRCSKGRCKRVAEIGLKQAKKALKS
jgi:hypothetical protein